MRIRINYHGHSGPRGRYHNAYFSAYCGFFRVVLASDLRDCIKETGDAHVRHGTWHSCNDLDRRPERFSRVGATTGRDLVDGKTREMFQKAFTMFTPFASTPRSTTSEKSASSASNEMDDLKRQLDEMQKRIEKLSDTKTTTQGST